MSMKEKIQKNLKTEQQMILGAYTKNYKVPWEDQLGQKRWHKEKK